MAKLDDNVSWNNLKTETAKLYKLEAFSVIKAESMCPSGWDADKKLQMLMKALPDLTRLFPGEEIKLLFSAQRAKAMGYDVDEGCYLASLQITLSSFKTIKKYSRDEHANKVARRIFDSTSLTKRLEALGVVLNSLVRKQGWVEFVTYVLEEVKVTEIVA